MVMDVLKSINWVDLMIFALFIRVMYMAVQEGFIVEVFKTFGLIIALFLSFHYYTLLGQFILRKVHSPQDMILAFSFCFIVIWVLVLVIFKYIREGLLLLFAIQTKTLVDRWGAAIVGLGRFWVLSSMIMFVLLTSGLRYVEVKTADSFFGRHMIALAPGIYQKICNGFVSRLLPAEKVNPAVREVMDKVSR